MTEPDYNTAQSKKQVETVKPPIPQAPQEPITLAGFKQLFDTYLPFLEKLRTGMWIKGSGSLVAGVLDISNNRIQTTSICLANFSSTGTSTNTLLTNCIAGKASIASSSNTDTNLVNYLIIF